MFVWLQRSGAVAEDFLMKTRKIAPWFYLCPVMVGLHLLTVLTGTQFYLTPTDLLAAYYGLVVIGLGVLMGYAGQISIGHAGFFAIGGYSGGGLDHPQLDAVARCLGRPVAGQSWSACNRP